MRNDSFGRSFSAASCRTELRRIDWTSPSISDNSSRVRSASPKARQNPVEVEVVGVNSVFLTMNPPLAR